MLTSKGTSFQVNTPSSQRDFRVLPTSLSLATTILIQRKGGTPSENSYLVVCPCVHMDTLSGLARLIPVVIV